MLYIFDLGNVLIDIDFNRALKVFSDYSHTPLDTLVQKFSMDEAFCLHEKGLISDEAFALHINQSLDINLSFDEFLEGWCALLIRIRPNILELLSALKAQNHTIVMLSNTNNAHTVYWKTAFEPLLVHFDKLFLSYQMGMRKPDEEIYFKVLETMQSTKEEAVFFDDNHLNIQTAKRIGLPCLQIDSHQVLLNYFKQRGITL